MSGDWGWAGYPAALIAGFGLGAAYFWGLWWTSRRVVRASSPTLLVLGSFLVRMVVLIGGVYWVTGGRPVETAISLVGILIARRAIVRRVGWTNKGEEGASDGD